jgi:hypothetical protein
MAISFVTVLLSLTTMVPVVITPVVAAPVVVVVIAAVIIAGRVSTIAVVASASSWIDTRSSVVHNVVVCTSGCA